MQAEGVARGKCRGKYPGEVRITRSLTSYYHGKPCPTRQLPDSHKGPRPQTFNHISRITPISYHPMIVTAALNITSPRNYVPC